MARSFLWPLSAAWLWCDAATRSYHNVVCFRRTFDVRGGTVSATLHVTADARYEAHVNGVWVGFGPPRAWPGEWPVDAYDLTGLLRPGRNVLTVLVRHYGLSTFQYLHADPGLLAQIDWHDAAGPHTLGSDAAWKAHASAAHLWPVPRVSCMRGWEEQFDARRLPADWTSATFDDSAWPPGSVVRQAGEGAHAAFVRLDLPRLTREPTPAVRVLAVEAVRPADCVWSINPRDLLNPADKTANFVRGRLLLTTEIVSEAPQTAQFHRPHHNPWTDWSLNGEPLVFDDRSLQQTDLGVAHARLRAGRNTLLCRMKAVAHYWWAVLNVWTERPVVWQTPSGGPAATPWVALGPFGDDADRVLPADGMGAAYVDAAAFLGDAVAFTRLWPAGPTPADLAAPYARPVPADMVALDDVASRCMSERVVAGVRPDVRSPEALLHDTAEWTTVRPCEAGDVRLLLDFGRGVVGFQEFEIDAPAGTVVDVHAFEFVQPDGRFNLAEGMNNSFRYVCREGVQHYRSLLRRGFRYAWVSLRRFDRPVRVRFVRVLMSTYPQARRGRFACSDPLLDRIWEVGVRSVECCSEDTYTDCPTYEQTFWVGDGRNEALVDLVANGDARLSANSLRVAAGSLSRSPVIESQAPSGWQNVLPAWSFLWMRWAEEHVRMTGDLELGRELVEANAKQVGGYSAAVGGRGLIKMLAWNLFDWAAMDTPADGEVTHVQCLAVLGLRQTATLARTVGDAARAAEWDAFADRLSVAVNTHQWDDAKRAYVDCIRADGSPSPVFSQQTQTAAYLSGVATGDRAEQCRRAMHDAPPGFVKAGSPFFMFFLLEGLVREGRFEGLLTTIRDYWGPQIAAGATTFWETYYRDRPRLTRSHCHGWSAAPTYFLSRYVLGVSPATPGYASVCVEPRPGGLTWARGAVAVPGGAVEVDWQHTAAAFTLRLVLPDERPAEVVWPGPGEPVASAGRVLGRTGDAWRVAGPVVCLASAENGSRKA